MRLFIAAIAIAVLAPTFVLAQKKKAPEVINPADYIVPVADPANYSVPVEAFTLGKAKVKTHDFAFSAGDYIFASSTDLTFVTDRQGLFKYTKESAVTVDYSFTRLDSTPVRLGRCVGTVKIKSGPDQKSEFSPYFCRSEGGFQTGEAFEAVVPSLTLTDEETLLSVQTEDPEKFKALKAMMRYSGVVYDALPTGLTPSRESEERRVANGWAITREGKLVGRIDFPNYKGLIVDEHGGYQRKSVITAPLAESDGREAVIFFASQLLLLPEANAQALWR